MNKMHTYPDTENSHQGSFLMETEPVPHVTPPRNTLREAIPASELIAMLAQKSTEGNHSLLQTEAGPTTIEREEFLAHSQKMTQLVSEVPKEVSKAEDKDSARLDTASMHIVRRGRAKNEIRSFFANLVVILAGTLFLGMLAAIMLVATAGIAKIEAFVIFLIALSYTTNLQVKHICRARKQAYLTTPHLWPESKESPITSKDEDTEHLKLIKQDTSTYLHGLLARDQEKMH